MKKRRAIAMALAATMVFSSFSTVAYADDTVTPAAAEATVEDAVSDTDDNSSGSALDAYAADTYMNGGMITNVAEDGDWKATVTGDSGSQPKVSGEEMYEGTGDNAVYTGVPYYSVIENDDSTVDMRMGLFDKEGTLLEAVGKISSSSDGLTAYYKELQASDSFELSATAKIINLDSTSTPNQIAFGLFLRDEMQPMTNYKSKSEMIFVGPVQMANVGKSNGMLKVMARHNNS